MKKIILLLLIPLIISGCYNMNEINDLSIITIIGIDYKDNKYIIDAGIVNFKNDKENLIVISSSGKTIAEALNNLNKYYPKKVYLSHMKVLLISENTLKEKALDSINYLINYPGTGLNFYIITTENNNNEFIKTITPANSISTTSIVNSLENGLKDTSTIPLLTADMFLNDLISNGKSPIIPLINIKQSNPSEEKKEKLFSIDGALVLNKENEITKLTKDEVIGFNILTTSNATTNITSLCKEGKITIDLTNIKTDIKYEDRNKFKINVSAKSDVSDYSCKMERSIKTEEYIKSLTRKLIESKIDSVIDTSVNSKTDFIGFGSIIYANDYKFFKNISDNYEKEYLKDIKYDINIDLKFSNTGNLRTNIKGSD